MSRKWQMMAYIVHHSVLRFPRRGGIHRAQSLLWRTHHAHLRVPTSDGLLGHTSADMIWVAQGCCWGSAAVKLLTNMPQRLSQEERGGGNQGVAIPQVTGVRGDWGARMHTHGSTVFVPSTRPCKRVCHASGRLPEVRRPWTGRGCTTWHPESHHRRAAVSSSSSGASLPIPPPAVYVGPCFVPRTDRPLGCLHLCCRAYPKLEAHDFCCSSNLKGRVRRSCERIQKFHPFVFVPCPPLAHRTHTDRVRWGAGVNSQNIPSPIPPLQHNHTPACM